MEERVEIIHLSRHEGWSCQKRADKFNVRHLRSIQNSFSTVAKVIWKFEETGRIVLGDQVYQSKQKKLL